MTAKQRVQVYLRGFEERQKRRVATRRAYQERALGTELPTGRIERRPLDPHGDIYTPFRSPEVHTEIRRIR
jgi:hypothetical protein